MILNLTHEYRIHPDADQEAKMCDWLEQCRRVYNYAVAERRDWIRSRKCDINSCSIDREYIIPVDVSKPTYIYQQNQLTKYRQTSRLLQAAHSQVLQGALRQVDNAFKGMWNRGYGFPRFKKSGRMRSFLFPQLGKNPIQLNILKLPTIGLVKMTLHRPIPEGFNLKQARIVKRASGWYALLCLQCDVDVPQVMPHGEPLGIDLGLEKFLATSNGELIARPKFFVDLQGKLRWLQRKLKDMKKGSNNWKRAQQKVARLHVCEACAKRVRIYNTRRDFHRKLAHHLCDNAGMIFAEDLNLKATSRGMLCKYTLDAGWGSFLDILKFVCFRRGVYFAKVDPNGTSQTCPQCQAHTGKKELEERVYHCDECGYTTDRDVAAAIVVMQRGCVAVGHTVVLAVEEDCLGVPLMQQSPKSDLWKPSAKAVLRFGAGRMSLE